METLKINYIMYGTGRTGGVRVLLNFVNELAKLGHEVSITTPYYDDWFPLDPSVKIISKKTRLDLYLFYGSQIISKRDYIRKNTTLLYKLMSMIPKSDINVATYSPTAYIASWKSIDGSVPFYHMQHLETLFTQDSLMKKFILDTYFLPIPKIANSIWLQRKLVLLTRKEYPIVNPAVEHSVFFPHYGKNAVDRGGNEVHIVALGKGGWKNAKGIYDAVEQVRKKIKNRKIVLHYFGSKPLSSIPFDGSSTVFHRDLTDEQLAELYSKSDIQITFSTAESFPLPPLEAMACGCAVITTPYGVEDYVVDGENALLTQPGDIDMLASKINLLIENDTLRGKLEKNGLKTAQRFKYGEQVKVLEREIRKAMEDEISSKIKREIL
ncbi:MAG: glycosyltransferase [Thermoplasmatales archaeon]